MGYHRFENRPRNHWKELTVTLLRGQFQSSSPRRIHPAHFEEFHCDSKDSDFGLRRTKKKV